MTTVIRWTANVSTMHSSQKGTAEYAWVPTTEDVDLVLEKPEIAKDKFEGLSRGSKFKGQGQGARGPRQCLSWLHGTSRGTWGVPILVGWHLTRDMRRVLTCSLLVFYGTEKVASTYPKNQKGEMTINRG